MRNKNDLIKILEQMLFEYNQREDIQAHVLDEFRKIGYENGYGLITGSAPLYDADNIKLGVLTKFLGEAIEQNETIEEYREKAKESLSLGTYFYDGEIIEIDNCKYVGENSQFPLVFENVIKIGDAYVTSITPMIANDLRDRGIINYNFSAQREAKYTKTSGGRIVSVINLSETAKKDILNKMKENTYKTDFIAINILKEVDSDFEYVEEENKLIIKNGRLDINDGWHRYRSLLDFYKLNPKTNFEIGLKITNYTLDDAKDAVVQFDKQRKMNLEHTKKMSNLDLENWVVNEINDDNKSDFKSKIVTHKDLINKKMGYTYFSTMSQCVKILFEDQIKTRARAERLKDYLISFLNEVYDIFLDDFKEFDKSEERDVIPDLKTHSNTFIIYMSIAKIMHENGNWNPDKIDELRLILSEEGLDFSFDGDMNSELKLKTVTKTTTIYINKVYKYIKDKIEVTS